MHAYRTHTCGDLRSGHAGANVRLSGWIHRKRDHGGLMFIDLRDNYGLTQLVLHPDSPGFAIAERARADRLEITFQTADAEALPFADASFDAVVSTFGVMFTPDHAKAAAEMVRVARPGGRIGLANWTPDSLIGRMFKVLGRYVTPPAGVQPPSLWGTEAHLNTLFCDAAATVRATPRDFAFRYRSAAHFIDIFRTWYGPVNKAFAAQTPEKADALAAELTELLDSLNRAGPGSLVVPSGYLEVVVTLR